MAGSVMKGALISYPPSGSLGQPSQPNVIVFQINPETMTHAWTEAAAPPPPSDTKVTVTVNPLAATGVPGETFAFTLRLDSDLDLSDIAIDPAAADAAANGVYPRLAALELLQFPSAPPDSGLEGQVSASNNAAAQGSASATTAPRSVPLSQVPVVLFSWGPLRTVPVRVTAFSVSEILYDDQLNPTHADAQMTLTVLTPDALRAVKGPTAQIGATAYANMQSNRVSLAGQAPSGSPGSNIGMLPAPY